MNAVLMAKMAHSGAITVHERTEMEVIEYIVSKSCFSRYQYTKKRREDLIKRYTNLKNRIKFEDSPHSEDFCNTDVEQISIFVSRIWLEQEQYLSICPIVSRNADVKRHIVPPTYDLQTFLESRNCNNHSFIIVSEAVLEKIALPENCPAHVILVAENGKSEAVISPAFTDEKSINVCQVEKVRQVISTHLERYAFTGMKEICEFLESALTSRYYLNDRQAEATMQFDQESLKEKALQISTEDILKYSRTRRSNSVQEKPGKRPQKHLQRSKSAKDYTHTKNKCRLGALGKEDKEMIERLIDEIVGMFNRSQLPKDEHPDLRNSMEETVNEKMLHDLRMLSPMIKSCGFRFSIFQIYVDSVTPSENLIHDIEKTLKRHQITSYSIVPSEINLYAKCCVGSKVSVNSNNEDKPYYNGTLGGFARTSSEESTRLWALMSRHVAKMSADGNVYINDGEKRVAKIMKQIKDNETEKPYLDIAAACVEKDVEENCGTTYITEEKVPVKGRLCDYDVAKLKGLPVHICGASTPLGLGTITVPKQESVQPNGLDENYIVVEDRDTDEKTKFCTNGDSGAIVCAECPDMYGEEVQLISMVVGENIRKEGSYTTVRLDKGLAELDTFTEKEFKLC